MSFAGRTFVGDVTSTRDDVMRLPRTAGHHVARVIRARVGDALGVFDAKGREARCTIVAIARDDVDVRVEPPGWRPGLGADTSDVTWLQGVPKGDKLETIVRQATEMGVAALQPVFTSRSVPRAGGATARGDRLVAAAIAACEQCGRSVLPDLRPACGLSEALAAVSPSVSLRLVPWEEGGASIVSVVERAAPGACAVLVGPEGGLAMDEVDLARAHGFVPVSLGPRILRTETVAPALLGLLSALRGDLAGRFSSPGEAGRNARNGA